MDAGPELGDDPHTAAKPWRTKSGGNGGPRPQVEVYPTQYGDVMQVVVPPTVYETVQARGYHHLGDLYTADHRVKGERTLRRGRLPARVSPASERGLPATAPSWRPSYGQPHRGGRPHQRT